MRTEREQRATRRSSARRLTPMFPAIRAARAAADPRLGDGAVRSDAGRRAAPAGRISADERHALAIRQSLRWAQRAAREGDYDRALAWLRMVEYVEGRLGEQWRRAREGWTAAWAAQVAEQHRRQPGRR
ncbi:MAG: hypothetical protein JSS99_02335 [Actinobacteria bacterium]|nr:hypothetical protein [Actinomycetota bacterium]